MQMHPGTGSLCATNPGPYLRGDWLEVFSARRWARTSAWWATEYYQVCFNSIFVILNLTDNTQPSLWRYQRRR
jgi:hypothetical protein